MSKIIFESGLELQSDFIETSQIYSHGANRNCLQIHLKNGDFTNLKDFAKTNLINGTVTINDNDNDFVYTNYEIFHELKYNGSEYIPMLIGVILLIGQAQIVRTLIESISRNNNWEKISVGELFLKAKYYIKEEIQYNSEIFGKEYTISNEVKMSLLDSLDIIKDKEIRAECTIAFLSF